MTDEPPAMRALRDLAEKSTAPDVVEAARQVVVYVEQLHARHDRDRRAMAELRVREKADANRVHNAERAYREANDKAESAAAERDAARGSLDRAVRLFNDIVERVPVEVMHEIEAFLKRG